MDCDQVRSISESFSAVSCVLSAGVPAPLVSIPNDVRQIGVTPYLRAMRIQYGT